MIKANADANCPIEEVVDLMKRNDMTGYWQRRTTKAIHIKLSEKTMNLGGGLRLSTVRNLVLNPP